MNTDSAVPGLNRDIALGSEVKIPPIELVHKFSSLASCLIESQKINNQQIKTLEALRDTLLPKLMSGKVSVTYEQNT